MLKNAFLYRVALHEPKKRLYRESNKFISRNFTNFTQSHFFYAQKLLLHVPFFAVLKNCLFTYKKPFFRTNLFYCHPKLLFSTLRRPFQPTLTYCLQKIPIFTNQKPFIRTNLSLFPSKAILFCPPPPIRTTLNLLFAKNTAVLLLFALNPYAVKPERRTDSNHCRRYPENCCFLRCRLPDECRTFQQKSRIDRRFESRSQGFAVSLKHGRLAHVRSQFSLFRRSPTHKNLPPATFCTSEHAFWLLFARCKK